VDNVSYFSADLTSDTRYNSFADPTNPFFFVLNLAVGGQFPNHKVDDSAFPVQYQIDYVRTYQTQMQIDHQERMMGKTPKARLSESKRKRRSVNKQQ